MTGLTLDSSHTRSQTAIRPSRKPFGYPSERVISKQDIRSSKIFQAMWDAGSLGVYTETVKSAPPPEQNQDQETILPLRTSHFTPFSADTGRRSPSRSRDPSRSPLPRSGAPKSSGTGQNRKDSSRRLVLKSSCQPADHSLSRATEDISGWQAEFSSSSFTRPRKQHQVTADDFGITEFQLDVSNPIAKRESLPVGRRTKHKKRNVTSPDGKVEVAEEKEGRDFRASM